MPASDITNDLEVIASSDNFEFLTFDLVDTWAASGVGSEAIRPILDFMEEHPGIEFGSPGGLVHFIERFGIDSYIDDLLGSILRRPTAHTAWMLIELSMRRRRPALGGVTSGFFKPRWQTR